MSDPFTRTLERFLTRLLDPDGEAAADAPLLLLPPGDDPASPVFPAVRLNEAPEPSILGEDADAVPYWATPSPAWRSPDRAPLLNELDHARDAALAALATGRSLPAPLHMPEVSPRRSRPVRGYGAGPISALVSSWAQGNLGLSPLSEKRPLPPMRRRR
jgi:hypothetical protein